MLVVRVLCLLGVVTLIGVPLWFLVVRGQRVGFGPQLAAIGCVLIDERADAISGARHRLLLVSVGLFALWQLWRLGSPEYSVGRGSVARCAASAWTLLAAEGACARQAPWDVRRSRFQSAGPAHARPQPRGATTSPCCSPWC